jgi:Flp pilus assembly protein TadB
MVGVIYFIGILVMILVIIVVMEYTPVEFGLFKKTKSLSGVMDEMENTTTDSVTGIRKTLKPLEKPVEKYTRPGLLKKMNYALYWGQMGGKYIGWTPIQLITLRLFLGILGAVAGAAVFGSVIYVVVCALLGWTFPMLSLNSAARHTNRRFESELPEYIQLINAKMAGGVSFDEAIKRTARAESLPALWMRKNIQMAQGRSLVDQIMQEAINSQSTVLISTGTQLSNLKYGTKQQELLDRLSTQISNAYAAGADMRAEKIGSDLVIPMVLAYFLPFLICIFVVIGYPIVASGIL